MDIINDEKFMRIRLLNKAYQEKDANEEVTVVCPKCNEKLDVEIKMEVKKTAVITCKCGYMNEIIKDM